MIRPAFLCAAALIAAPLAAQDHAGHAGHTSEAAPEMDHCAMGHLPPEQCPPRQGEAMDHSQHGENPRQHHSQHQGMDHSQHGEEARQDHSQHGATQDKSAPGAAPEEAVPSRALEGPRHAADAIWGKEAMAPAREELAEGHGEMKTGMAMIERLEARFPTQGGETGYVWDAQAWYGGDLNRFVLKTEGEGEFGGELESAEVQALYSRAIGPFFDLQAGVRFDPEPDARGHIVLGVQGLAPYMFHVDGALFLSDEGDLTARLKAEYDQKITQALILQPRIEIEASAQDIPARRIASGITKIEPGLRLRYEIEREFAPYIGVEYEAKTGGTADIARANGKDPDAVKLLVGLRAWF